ncbi:MAG: ATP-binding protein, partial [Saprospiraceae bacterium]|nr:ATP-binding protein [Saprospiraceae bacterium]
MPQENTHGDNVARDKIGKQTIMGGGSTYNDNPTFIINKDAEAPRLLTTPPFNTEVFIGRQPDLDAIEADYQQQNRLLVLVNGEGGIGKTTLAAKYWYAHEARYRHLAWVYSDTGIGAALVTLREVLGVQFDPHDTLEQQVQRMAGALIQLEKPCLLVFDNANNAADLKQYYALLNQLGQCNIHILLTSRVPKVAGMHVHAVKPLTEAQAIELFRYYYEGIRDEELPLLRDILKALGYNTLVLEVLAKNMAVTNRYAQRYTLDDLLRDLQGKGLLALKNKTVQVMYGSDTLREATPTEIIGAMYDLAQLDEQERYLLSNLSVLPAENIPYTLLNTLLGVDDDRLETPLGSLEEKGWLEYQKEDNSFKISPVVQGVTREKNAERLLENCRVMVKILLRGLNDDNRHTDNYRQAEVYARMGEVVIQAIHNPVHNLGVLCQNIGNFHIDTGNLNMAMSAYQKMSDIRTKQCAAYPNNEVFKRGLAISYEKLGSTYTKLGNLQQALKFFEERNKMSQELYNDYPNNMNFKNGLAISYEKLGSTHSALGNLQEALKFFEERNKMSQELYNDYPNNVNFKNGLAISYEKLGSTHTALGNLQEALKFFEERNKMSQELYNDYPNNVNFKNGLAISYERLGSTHTALGNLQQALKFFKEYNKLEKELYNDFPNNVNFKSNSAISYEKLGSTHTALGNLQQALKFFEEYNKLEKELYNDFPNNVNFKSNSAISYERLGSTHTKLGNLQQALKYFEDETQLFEKLYNDYPTNVNFKNGLAISYEKLG